MLQDPKLFQSYLRKKRMFGSFKNNLGGSISNLKDDQNLGEDSQVTKRLTEDANRRLEAKYK